MHSRTNASSSAMPEAALLYASTKPLEDLLTVNRTLCRTECKILRRTLSSSKLRFQQVALHRANMPDANNG
jgi:hypothetical protein